MLPTGAAAATRRLRMHQIPPPSAAPDRALPFPEPGPGALWRGLVEQIPAVTYVAEFDAGATLKYVSPQIEELLGYTPDAFLRDPALWYACVHPDDLDRVRREELRTFESRTPFDCEFRMVHRDGHEVIVWERDAIITDADGAPTHTQGVLMDVTPMHLIRDELDAERESARRYLEVAGAAIVVLDRAGRVELLNRSGYKLAGHPEGTLQGRDFLGTVLDGDDLAEARTVFAAAMDTGHMPPSTEWRLVRTDGARTVAWTHRVMRDEHGEVIGTVSSGTDVTERRAAAAQIAHLANHDPVTDLPNRRLFGEHLELALARAARAGHAVGLLYLDLDDFKLVNDSLGHSAGDRLLVEVAQRLRARVRDADVLARHGGDEFLVLLGDLDPATAAEDAKAAGRGVLDALAVPFVLAGMEVHVTGSVGISLLPADAFDAESLLRHADAAMYQAKREGHDQVRLFDADRGEPRQRLSLTSRLRHAIAEEQLVLHWQPIVDPATRRLEALEALVRWQDPVRGLVMPDAFVALAEQAGIIDRLGELVLDLVVRQRVRWRQDDGFEPTVHVNLSPRELRNPRFADRVATRLADHHIDPATVVMEITESTAMQDPGQVRPLLRDLHDTGVRIAIDDFGAGHSSLSRLVGLPVDMLKIDRSFLARVPADPASAAVLSAVVALAGALNLQAVAEGVETESQREQLVGLGCPLAQGFLLGRPGPAHTVRGQLQRAAA
ncbi:hypothetical protein DSM112329_03221 [Paraconexibacter sp. AEG42_29]|uniref:EAL domain-containing protein n=1 Tax=Paraconexibacter sp. AEG42_29 TaxID=2997339 RepID=A0AAU7AXG6_9ACTN